MVIDGLFFLSNINEKCEIIALESKVYYGQE